MLIGNEDSENIYNIYTTTEVRVISHIRSIPIQIKTKSKSFMD